MIFWFRISLATLLPSAFGLTFHVLYRRGVAAEYMNNAIKTGKMDGVLQEPYPLYIIVIAALTSLIPTIGKVFIWLFDRDKLPGNKLLTKGFFHLPNDYC